MTSWILLAVFGHVMNAIAFIIDKTLLKSTFKQGATYAILISVLSTVVLFATPWVTIWPSSEIIFSVVVFGLFQTFALWAFFEALKRGEASRVVPIVGVFVALFTFVGISLTIGEAFGMSQYVGFALLVASTGILAWGGEGGVGKIHSTVLYLSLISAALFAISSVSGKYAFASSDFLGVFVASRFYMVAGGFILLIAHRRARMEIVRLCYPKKSNQETVSQRAVALTIIAQSAGAVGFILVNYAISLGSASLVNAMQAVQYGLIVLVAWFGGKTLRRVLNERRTPLIVIMKSIAIILVGIGLYLISRSTLS